MITDEKFQLWPRISRSIAETIYQEEVAKGKVPPATMSHAQMTFGPTGGRVTTREIERFRSGVLEVATRFGFGSQDGVGSAGTSFDREVAAIVRRDLSMTWEEAGQSGVWSMVSLMVLPDVTYWRWSSDRGNPSTKERWICVDPTRHAWGRLWWQETMCHDRPGLLEKFNESELNQFFERTSFTRHREFFIYFLEAVVPFLDILSRRELIRDVAKRMRRRLAFIDTFSLTNVELKALVNDVVEESASALRRG